MEVVVRPHGAVVFSDLHSGGSRVPSPRTTVGAPSDDESGTVRELRDLTHYRIVSAPLIEEFV